MLIEVNRLKDDTQSTIGAMMIDGNFEGFTLEDTHNEPKVYGETCIPSGEYNITLRTDGNMTQKYAKRYGDTHRGMLWLRDVPNFEYVYIHIGNKSEDTDGCLLVGTSCDSAKGRQFVGGSALKYISTYKKILRAIDNGEEVKIVVRD